MIVILSMLQGTSIPSTAGGIGIDIPSSAAATWDVVRLNGKGEHISLVHLQAGPSGVPVVAAAAVGRGAGAIAGQGDGVVHCRGRRRRQRCQGKDEGGKRGAKADGAAAKGQGAAATVATPDASGGGDHERTGATHGACYPLHTDLPYSPPTHGAGVRPACGRDALPPSSADGSPVRRAHRHRRVTTSSHSSTI